MKSALLIALWAFPLSVLAGERADVAPVATITDTVRITDCAGQSVMLLEQHLLQNDQSYLWQHMENGVAVPLQNATRAYFYEMPNQKDTVVCEVITTHVDAVNNLMASGAFESCAPDFESDYQNAWRWDTQDAYQSCRYNGSSFYDICPNQYKSNLYAITRNANTFWRDYQVTAPHGGQYFALFDAGQEGYAWKAETARGNPNLRLEKDSIYLFSYWAAHPNTPSYSNSPAELQFVLILRDATLGRVDTVNLGQPYRLYQTGAKDNLWHKVEVQWQNTLYNCSDVTIGVYDVNNDAGVGNDFCLDDIMFQKTTYIEKQVVYRTYFLLEPKSQQECCPAVKVGNTVDTLICQNEMPFVWHTFAYGEPFEVHFETLDKVGNCQIDTVVKYKQTNVGCDSVRFSFVLHTQMCCPDLILGPTFDTLVCAQTEFPFRWSGTKNTDFIGSFDFNFAQTDGTGVATKDTILRSVLHPECDSIAFTFRVVKEYNDPNLPYYDSVSVSLCASQLPYQWEGSAQPITAAGDYSVLQTTRLGCDSALQVLHLEIAPAVEQYKKWGDVVFIPDSIGKYASYQWYHNDQMLNGANEQFYHDEAGLSGSYYCIMTTQEGQKEQSCPQDFDEITPSAPLNPGDANARQVVQVTTLWLNPVVKVVVTLFDDNSVQAQKICVVP